MVFYEPHSNAANQARMGHPHSTEAESRACGVVAVGVILHDQCMEELEFEICPLNSRAQGLKSVIRIGNVVCLICTIPWV